MPRAAQVFALDGGVPAVAVLHDNGLSILTRSGREWTRRDIAAPRFAADLAVLDLDADGHADVILADQTSGVLSLLRGNGDGTFETAGTTPTARGPERVIAADATGDKRLDLLVIGDEGLFLQRVTADGHLSPPQLVWPSQHVADVAVSDITGDGRPDIVLTDRSAGTAVMLVGGADGNFRNASAYLVGGGAGDGARWRRRRRRPGRRHRVRAIRRRRHLATRTRRWHLRRSPLHARIVRRADRDGER